MNGSWMLVASAGVEPVQVVLAVIGGGGILGVVVAVVKLRPDIDTAAVTQSQGAVETMALLQKELLADRDAWRTRAQTAESELRLTLLELDRCKKAHGRRTRDAG